VKAGERGFLLLTSQLGNPERKPLTTAQFRDLANRAVQKENTQPSRELSEEDVISLGYDRPMAHRIVSLLADEERLERYLFLGNKQACHSVCRVSANYPVAVRKRLGLNAPGSLWLKGDASLLQIPCVALVGSRELETTNRLFAEAVGREAARQGIVLVSGNARGADRTAQDACLANGGKVICVVADELYKYPLKKNVLYMAEDGFDVSFSSQRALSRNRVIHTLGYITFVAQCGLGTGGTWDGTVKNLHYRWSPVFCFGDGSPAAAELEQLGATLITKELLSDIPSLHSNEESLF